MPTPKDLSQITSDESARLDLALRQLKASQGQLGNIPPEAAREQRAQVLQAFGIPPGAGQPTRELGFQNTPGAPVQELGQLGGRDQRITGLEIGAPVQNSEFAAPGLDVQLPPQVSGLDIPLQNDGLGGESTIVQALPPRKRRGPKWMRNPEAVERAAFTMAGKVRTDKGKGKGKFVPFNALPGKFQVEFLAESGVSESPAGWWTGDLGRREKTMLNKMALAGAQEASLKNRAVAGSGSANDLQRRLAASRGIEP